MTGLALKSLWARRIRALTTILAVVIGVAFVAGTYILTDTTSPPSTKSSKTHWRRRAS